MQAFLKRAKDASSRNKAKYGFGDYHSYNEMVQWMNDIEYYYPHMAKVFSIGTTYEGRHIRGIKVTSPFSILNFFSPSGFRCGSYVALTDI